MSIFANLCVILLQSTSKKSIQISTFEFIKNHNLMRKNIVAGNWKMHKTQKRNCCITRRNYRKKPNTTTEIIVAPTFVNLSKAVELTNGKGITVAAQNMHQAEGGAFTGEIAASMLTDIGVNTVILGHSERRAYFHETDALLASKVDTALKHEMRIIFCFGEELKETDKLITILILLKINCVMVCFI